MVSVRMNTAIRMVLDPRQEPLVHLLKQQNILDIVRLHSIPGILVFVHALDPQLKAFVRHLLPQSQSTTNIV